MSQNIIKSTKFAFGTTGTSCPSLEMYLALGTEPALIFQQLHFSFDLETNGKWIDGKRWIYNSYEEWRKQFPWMTTRTIRRIFTELKAKGLIEIEQLGGRKTRKNYYRLTDNYEEIMQQLMPNDHVAKLARSGCGQNGLFRSSYKGYNTKDTSHRKNLPAAPAATAIPMRYRKKKTEENKTIRPIYISLAEEKANNSPNPMPLRIPKNQHPPIDPESSSPSPEQAPSISVRQVMLNTAEISRKKHEATRNKRREKMLRTGTGFATDFSLFWDAKVQEIWGAESMQIFDSTHGSMLKTAAESFLKKGIPVPFLTFMEWSIEQWRSVIMNVSLPAVKFFVTQSVLNSFLAAWEKKAFTEKLATLTYREAEIKRLERKGKSHETAVREVDEKTGNIRILQETKKEADRAAQFYQAAAAERRNADHERAYAEAHALTLARKAANQNPV